MHAGDAAQGALEVREIPAGGACHPVAWIRAMQLRLKVFEKSVSIVDPDAHAAHRQPRFAQVPFSPLATPSGREQPPLLPSAPTDGVEPRTDTRAKRSRYIQLRRKRAVRRSIPG
jgi:hypothetical protein